MFSNFKELAYNAALVEAQRTYSSNRTNTAFIIETMGISVAATIILTLYDAGMLEEEIAALPKDDMNEVILNVLSRVGYNVSLLD